jgi:3-dehydroquinate dehydratase-2
MKLLIINGPNLNLLGTREPDIYGTTTLSSLEAEWKARARASGMELDTFQSNHEGLIIDALHDARGSTDGIVLNAGALTHYSYALHDAIVACEIPTVEVHISNVHEREEWRRTSVISPAAETVIMGRGTDGYTNAIDHLHALVSSPPSTHRYGPDADNVLDIRTPDGDGPFKVAVLVHGGFWRSIYGRDLMDPMAIDLLEHGWATVNIEYRRGAGSYPAACEDVDRALDWVKSNALQHRFDPGTIVAIGHSAGGYLVVNAAHVRDDLAGVVGLSAVTDLVASSEERPQDDPVAAFIGGPRATHGALWSEAEITGHPASPISLIHGALDVDVNPSQSESYVQLRGGHTPLSMLGDTGHMELIDPSHAAWDSVIRALEAFSS